MRVNSLLRSADETIKSECASPHERRRPRIQLLLPPDAVEAFVAEARARCDDWRVGVQGVDVRNILPEEDTFLRWARKPYAEVGLQLSSLQTIGGAVRDTQLRRELIDAAIAAGGSFPIARTPDATREQVAACYPELPAFLAEKRRLDPAEKLINSWYLHHRSLFDRKSCEVRWVSASASVAQAKISWTLSGASQADSSAMRRSSGRTRHASPSATSHSAPAPVW